MKKQDLLDKFYAKGYFDFDSWHEEKYNVVGNNYTVSAIDMFQMGLSFSEMENLEVRNVDNRYVTVYSTDGSKKNERKVKIPEESALDIKLLALGWTGLGEDHWLFSYIPYEGNNQVRLGFARGYAVKLLENGGCLDDLYEALGRKCIEELLG